MIYIFSDIHLRTETQPWEKSFLTTLETCLKSPQTQQIILVGDILDTCPGGNRQPWEKIYPHFFGLLKQASVPILYLEGNHDFGLQTRLSYPHIVCEPHSTTLQWGQKRFYISHGDRIDQTWGYRLLYGCLRSWPLRWLVDHLPLSFVVFVARHLSRYSRSSDVFHLSHHQNLRQQFHEFVQKKWREGFDGVILGHNHTVEQMGSEHQIYLNCGFWPRDATYFEITPSPWCIRLMRARPTLES